MITIKYVRIIGFASIIDKIKYKFQRSGLNIITGENGSGKTQIFNALSWCLYGQTLKAKSSVKPWEHIMPKDFKGTRVQVEFDRNNIEYKVIRCLDFRGKLADGKKGGNRLILLINGVGYPGKDKKEIQKKIEEILGYSFILFKSAVLFGQEVKRLMEEEGPDKKRIFEEAFEVMYISKARKVVEDRIIPKQASLNDTLNKITIQDSIEQGIKTQIKDQLKIRKTFQRQKKNEIEAINEQIKRNKRRLRDKVELWKEQQMKFRDIVEVQRRLELAKKRIDPKLRDEEFNQQLKVFKLGEQIDALDGKAVEIKNRFIKIRGRCSQCGNVVPIDKVVKIKKDLKKEINVVFAERKKLQAIFDKENKVHEGIKLKIASQDKIKKGIDSMEMKIKELENIRKTRNDTENDMKIMNSRIKDYKNQIEVVKARGLKTNIHKLRKNLKDVKNINLGFKEERDRIEKDLKIDQWLMKDPLSNSGLKAFIFDTMIAKINHQLRKYERYIGFRPEIYVDMDSANKDMGVALYKKDNLVLYPDMSKGQKQLINVALIFSINDIITKTKPINLLILDEVFESLSSNNIEVVGDIINAKAKEKSIHLITHHPHFNPINSYKTELILDENGHTKINQKLRQA